MHPFSESDPQYHRTQLLRNMFSFKDVRWITQLAAADVLGALVRQYVEARVDTTLETCLCMCVICFQVEVGLPPTTVFLMFSFNSDQGEIALWYKREACFPNPRQVLIGSNRLWHVNDFFFFVDGGLLLHRALLIGTFWYMNFLDDALTHCSLLA